MGEHFVILRPLVPLPTIYCKNTCVENELIQVVHDLLRRVGRGAGIGVRNCIINLLPDNLNGVGGGVCLVEALVVREPVGVGDDGVGLVQVVEHIQSDGSTIPSMWPVFDPHEVFLDIAQKLMTKGAVYVSKGVERQHGRVTNVADGRCFRSGDAFQDDGRCSKIWRGDDPCC